MTTSKTIEILITPDGQSTVKTQGFAGAECQSASRFLEEALGQRVSEELTPEFYQAQTHYGFGECVAFPLQSPFRSSSRMKILYINNDGSGFADYLEITPGTTVQALFEKQVPSGRPEDYLIRVNRQPVSRDYVLQDGDRVSFTPTKIEGAA